MTDRICTGRTPKHRYPNEIAAKLALAGIKKADNAGRPKQESRAYHCNLCGGWHLTSAPKKSNSKKDRT